MASTLGIYRIRCVHCGKDYDSRFRHFQRLMHEEQERMLDPGNKAEPRDTAELLDRAGLYSCCRKSALGEADVPVGDPLTMRGDLKSNRSTQKPTGKLLVAGAGAVETKGSAPAAGSASSEAKVPRRYQLTKSRAWETAVKEYNTSVRNGTPGAYPDLKLMPISDRISRGSAVEEVTAPEFDLIEDLVFGEGEIDEDEDEVEEQLQQLKLQ